MDSNELPVLAYKDGENSVAPIPAHEQQLPTVTAEPWLEISKQGLQLEGLCFDRQGNLLLCEVFGGTIFHVNLPDKKSLNYLNRINKTQQPSKFIKMADYLSAI